MMIYDNYRKNVYVKQAAGFTHQTSSNVYIHGVAPGTSLAMSTSITVLKKIKLTHVYEEGEK